MADAVTTTASLSFDQVMWDRAVRYSLRPELYFDMFADVESTDAAPNQGASVTFTIVTDLAAATATLSETVDVDAVALADSQVTLNLEEKGNAVVTTFRVRATSFSSVPINRIAANAIGFNAGLSLDTISRDVIVGGSNVRYAGTATSRATVASTHLLDSHDVRRARVELAGANVQRFPGGYYASVIHPDVALDLREETGTASWRDPHTYSQPAEIWNGELGEFEGFRFVESPRAAMFADAGVSSTVDVYATLFFGREALAKGYSTYEGRGALPITILGPVTDKLKRLQPISWHWFGKYGIFRQAALRRVESASSVGAN